MTPRQLDNLLARLSDSRMEAYRMAGEILGVHPTTVRQWIAGRRKISPAMGQHIERELMPEVRRRSGLDLGGASSRS